MHSTIHTHYRTNYLGEELYSPISSTNNRFLAIEMFGITHPNPEYGLYHNPHRFHVFEYVVSGKGYIDFGAEHITISAGDFYFLPKGFVGHYYADKDEPYEKIWINAAGTLIDDLIKTFNINTPVIIQHTASTLEKIIRRIHNTFLNCKDDDYKKTMKKTSLDIFEIFSELKVVDALESTEYFQNPIKEIKEYIRSCVFSELDLSLLAEHFHLNPSYLIRKFKKATKLTPISYFNKCRIDAAREMLAFGNIRVKDVASALRYSDTAYFSASFKSETGYAPSEYTSSVHSLYLAKIK